VTRARDLATNSLARGHVDSDKSIQADIRVPIMTLNEILLSKGHEVLTIDPNATLDNVVQTLVSNRCGSLVVCEVRDCDGGSAGSMIGIITERDILKAMAAHGTAFGRFKVSEVMTKNVTVGSPNDSVEDTMGLMTRMRIRHLPVVEDGALLGLVSIGDVVKLQHDRLTMENHYLKSYLNDTPLAPT
jgi:CBS domain-containing protein